MKYRYLLWSALIIVNLLFFFAGKDEAPSVPNKLVSTTQHLDAHNQPMTKPPATVVNQLKLDPSRPKKMPQATSEHIIAIAAGKISDLLACYNMQNCNFPDDDPRAYELAVGQALKKELLELEDFVRKNKLVDEAIMRLSAKTMAIADGHVKEAALLLQIHQDPHPQALNAVLDHVIDYHDGELMPLALAELTKYKSAEDQRRIERRIIESLLRGGHGSRKKLAENLDKILNRDNFAVFEQVLGQLPATSDIHKIVAHQLAEFKRKVNGA